MCSKSSFETKKETKAEIKNMKMNKRNYSRNSSVDNKGKLTPYLCPNCDRWHITSMGKQALKRLYKLRGYK